MNRNQVDITFGVKFANLSKVLGKFVPTEGTPKTLKVVKLLGYVRILKY